MSGEHVRSARGLRPRTHRRNRSIGRATHTVCEQLETRRLLSTINWTNKGNAGSDTDGFNAAFGANSTVARAIVQRAIDDWERVIVDFNFSGGGNTFSVEIDAADLGPGTRGSTGGLTYDALDKPTSADITIDNNGGGSGWYFDPVIGSATVPDDGEFTTINTPFQANAAVAGFDLYRTAAHELGHAMGLASSSTRLTSIDVNIGDDPNDGGTASLFTIDVDGSPGADYCYTNAGGFHLYEGPSVGGNPTHPNDVMNSGRTAVQGRRQLISDTIATLLRDVYDYTVTLPSFLNTFYVNLNTSTNVVTVNGDINASGSDVDNIDLEVEGTAMSFEVNGTDETIEGAQFTSIVVNAGGSNDDVDVDELLSGKSVTVNGGEGNDNISAAQEFQDIDTNLGSNFTANGDGGTDTLVFNDQADSPGGDLYVIGSSTFVKNPDNINRVITYGTFESLVVNGSPQASTYNVNSLNTNLTINAGAAGDTISVGGTSADIDSLVNANVIVHGNGGVDSIIYNDVDDDPSVDDSYTLTSLGFSKSSTSETYGFDTVENVTLNAGQADNVINVLSMSNIAADVDTLVVDGGVGNDTINMGSGDLEIDFTFVAVTLAGGTGDDTMYLDDSDDAEFDLVDSYTITSTTFDKNTAGLNLVTYGTMEDVVLDCGTIGNIVNIDSFSTQIAPDLQTLLVNGRGGNDTFNLGTGDLETNLAFTAITVNGGAGVDSLMADDGGDNEGNDTYFITTTTLDKNTAGLTNPITYGTFEDVVLTCNTFNNTINVTSTLSGCTYTVSGNTGNDTFNAGGPTNNTDNIDGFITLNGNGGSDDFNYNDSANLNPQTYTVFAISVGRSGTAGVGYATMESAVVNCGGGSDTINVSSTLVSTPVTVNGNGGNDSLTAASGGDWDATLNSNLNFIGGADTDTLRINDTADTGADNYTVTVTNTTKSSIATIISYSVDSYVLDANDAINTITINSAFAAPFRVNGNGGADQIDLVGNLFGSFVTLDGGAGLDDITVNNDNAGAAVAHFDTTQDLASLTIFGGGTVVMEQNGNRVIDTDALTIAATGKLDLTDNDLIVDYAGASQLGIVQALINLGRAGGAWNGNGITSSTAGANPSHNTTLGAMEAAEFKAIYGAAAPFSGRAIDNTAVLVKYTYYGDADFNGTVNFDDYVRTDNGFNNHQGGWTNGDYDANGSVNFDDYVLIDNAFNTQSGVL